MKMGRYIDRFWAGIMLTLTVLAVLVVSGFMFEYFGLNPVFGVTFDLANMDIFSWLQIGLVAILMGISVAWLRRNSRAMRKM
jgi:hypothetical protein